MHTSRAFLLAIATLSTSVAFAQSSPSILFSYPVAQVQPLNTVTPSALFGSTQVALSAELVGALGSLGVTPGAIFPTTIIAGTASFPIVSGAIELNTAKGEINHSGGLTLTAGTTRVRLTSFLIDTTGTAPVLTGLVAANDSVVGRVPLFNLAPTGLTLPLKPGGGTLNEVKLTLTQTAATALNAIFSVSAFTAGFPIGSAQVNVFSAGG